MEQALKLELETLNICYKWIHNSETSHLNTYICMYSSILSKNIKNPFYTKIPDFHDITVSFSNSISTKSGFPVELWSIIEIGLVLFMSFPVWIFHDYFKSFILHCVKNSEITPTKRNKSLIKNWRYFLKKSHGKKFKCVLSNSA